MGLWALAALAESITVGIVRHVSDDLPPLQIAFMRMLCGLVILTPWLINLGLSGLRTSVFHLHAVRSGLQVVAMAMWFAAVPMVQLVDVAALNFLAPLFATLGAFLLLGEKVGWRRGTALAVGFAGVLVVVRPGAGVLNVGALLLVGSALCWAGGLLAIKKMAATEPSPRMTALSSLMITPCLLLPALWVWRDAGWIHWGLMMGAGLFGTATHLLMGQAFRHADASAVMPVDFTRMFWTTLIGWWAFGQMPGWQTWAGGTLIFAAALYVTWREAFLARQRRAAGGGP